MLDNINTFRQFSRNGIYSKLKTGTKDLESVVNFKESGETTDPSLSANNSVVTKSKANKLYEDPLVKSVMGSLETKAFIQMYEQFLQVYNGPLGNMDIKYRLGASKYLKQDRKPNVFTNKEGNIYTRSIYAFNFLTVDKPNQFPRVETYSSLYFPPYNNGNGVLARSDSNSFKNVTSSDQSNTFNTDTFRLRRDLLTYRDLGFKAINDLIEILQFFLEKTTGVVSTYLTEWDLSLYIQEGLYSLDKTRQGLIEPIHLTYRMAADNPAGYNSNNDQYVFGVINGAVSKFTCSKPWNVSKYPLSHSWLPYDNTSQLMYKPATPTVAEGTTFFSFKDNIQKFDLWNAWNAGWTDWEMPLYKALYSSPNDGLDDSDLDDYTTEINEDDFKDDDGNNVGGDMYKANVKKKNVSSKANRQLAKYGNGTDFVNNAKNAVDGKDWLGASADTANTQTSLAVGLKHRNPCFYGGPHGKDFSVGSPQALFEPSNTHLRNVPRINFHKNFKHWRSWGLSGHYLPSKNSKASVWKDKIFKEGESVKATYYIGYKAWVNSSYSETRSYDYYYNDYSRHHTWDNNYNSGNSIGYPQPRYNKQSNDRVKHQYNTYSFRSDSKRTRPRYDHFTTTSYYKEYKTVTEKRETRAYDCVEQNLQLVDYSTDLRVSTAPWAARLFYALIWFLNISQIQFAFSKSGNSLRVIPLYGGSSVDSISGDKGTFSWRKYNREKELLDLAKDTGCKQWAPVFFFGFTRNGICDALYKANIRYMNFSYTLSRYHKHRSHSCHYHYQTLTEEYVEMDTSSIQCIGSNLGTTPWSNYNKDLGLKPDIPLFGGYIGSVKDFRYTEDAGSSFKGNKKFYGLYKSLPGYDGGGLDDLPKFMRFSNFRVRKFRSNARAVSSYTDNLGCQVFPKSYTRTYSQAGYIRPEVAKAIRNFYISSQFVDSKNYRHRVFNLNCSRNILVALKNWKYSLQSLSKYWSILDIDKMKAYAKAYVGQNVFSAENGALTNKFRNPYFYEGMALTKQSLQSSKSSITSTNLRISFLIDRMEKILKKDWLNWTIQDYIDMWNACADAQNMLASEIPQYAVDLWDFLNVMYEVREFFINKRFNKVDGTYFMLRHLEQLTIASAVKSAVIDPGTPDLGNSLKEYDVVYTAYQNTVQKKAQALINHTSLPPDRITKLYIRVEYPKGVVTEEDARLWEIQNGWVEGQEHLLIKTSLREGVSGYDPEKVWAIKPKDSTYQLRSIEWDQNEQNRELNALALSEGKEAQKIIYNYEQCVKNITWKDEPGFTPISRGNTVGVDPSAYAEYISSVGDDGNALDALCACQETAEYWTVDLTDAVISTPEAEGYITDIYIKEYDPSAESQTGGEFDMFYNGRLYPIVEDQGVIISSIQDLGEMKMVLKQQNS